MISDLHAPVGISGFVVGAYAASPAHAVWHPDREQEFFEALAEDPRIGALELPWMGRLHPHDPPWLIAHLPARFDVILTDIPWIMQQRERDPLCGLASPDPVGRAAALRAVDALRSDIHRLHDGLGRRAVRAVELHSAPTGSRGSVEALAESLRLIAGENWDGAEIVIEHCDAWREDRPVEKGFLSLSAEIEAIRRSGTGVGLSMNWGRAAIELRDGDAVADLIREAADSRLLRGLMFSGASAEAGPHGPAWVDAHHPFRRSECHVWGDPHSLLTEERAAAAITAAGSLQWAGVKVGWPPAAAGSASQRAGMIAAALDACIASGLTVGGVDAGNPSR